MAETAPRTSRPATADIWPLVHALAADLAVLTDDHWRPPRSATA